VEEKASMVVDSEVTRSCIEIGHRSSVCDSARLSHAGGRRALELFSRALGHRPSVSNHPWLRQPREVACPLGHLD
jgi:hypothetical protein